MEARGQVVTSDRWERVGRAGDDRGGWEEEG